MERRAYIRNRTAIAITLPASAVFVSIVILSTLRPSVAAPVVRSQARVGILVSASQSLHRVGLLSLLPAALAKHGWIEGRNTTFEWRFAEGRAERLVALARELADLRVDLIVAAGNVEAQATIRATPSTPIVLASALDPVGTGLVQSLARPGGNITGLMWADPGVATKMLELLAEAAPKVRRVALLYDAAASGIDPYIDADEVAARARGLTILRKPVSRRDDIAAVLASTVNEAADALKVVLIGNVGAEVPRVLEFAASRRLPTVFPIPAPVYQGGLLSYSPNPDDASARVAALVDRLLKGAKAAEVPFEHPMRFDIVINLKSAKALGLTIPPALLLRASEIID